MSAQELDSRLDRLEKAFAGFSPDLRLARRYMEPDAASSLTKSRMVLEKLVIQVYAAEMGHEPRKPLLGDMLADNQFTRKVERRILSRMTGGRGSDCDIRLTDICVSREVFALNWDAEKEAFELIDFGCRNPMLVNGKKVAGRQLLAAGDLIITGQTVMRLEALA